MLLQIISATILFGIILILNFLIKTADMSSLTGEALAAAAALAGTVMLIKNHEDEFED